MGGCASKSKVLKDDDDVAIVKSPMRQKKARSKVVEKKVSAKMVGGLSICRSCSNLSKESTKQVKEEISEPSKSKRHEAPLELENKTSSSTTYEKPAKNIHKSGNLSDNKIEDNNNLSVRTQKSDSHSNTKTEKKNEETKEDPEEEEEEENTLKLENTIEEIPMENSQISDVPAVKKTKQKPAKEDTSKSKEIEEKPVEENTSKTLTSFDTKTEEAEENTSKSLASFDAKTEEKPTEESTPNYENLWEKRILNSHALSDKKIEEKFEENPREESTNSETLLDKKTEHWPVKENTLTPMTSFEITAEEKPIEENIQKQDVVLEKKIEKPIVEILKSEVPLDNKTEHISIEEHTLTTMTSFEIKTEEKPIEENTQKQETLLEKKIEKPIVGILKSEAILDKKTEQNSIEQNIPKTETFEKKVEGKPTEEYILKPEKIEEDSVEKTLKSEAPSEKKMEQKSLEENTPKSDEEEVENEEDTEENIMHPLTVLKKQIEDIFAQESPKSEDPMETRIEPEPENGKKIEDIFAEKSPKSEDPMETKIEQEPENGKKIEDKFAEKSPKSEDPMEKKFDEIPTKENTLKAIIIPHVKKNRGEGCKKLPKI